jgi:hypothetical protein
MHVLHRSHLGSAVAVTAIAALLAIVLTLAIASSLSDHAPPPAQPTASAPVQATPVQATPIRPRPSKSPFTRSPFSSLLTTPVKQPWAQNLTRAD